MFILHSRLLFQFIIWLNNVACVCMSISGMAFVDEFHLPGRSLCVRGVLCVTVILFLRWLAMYIDFYDGSMVPAPFLSVVFRHCNVHRIISSCFCPASAFLVFSPHCWNHLHCFCDLQSTLLCVLLSFCLPFNTSCCKPDLSKKHHFRVDSMVFSIKTLEIAERRGHVFGVWLANGQQRSRKTLKKHQVFWDLSLLGTCAGFCIT